MEVEKVDDAARFLDAAEPLLLRDEARHNLILGIAGILRDSPNLYPEFNLWLVTRGREPVAAALRTPPHNLVLARPRDSAALRTLAGEIEDDLPGVVGALPEAEAFAALWADRRGLEPRKQRGQGVFALERVTPPPETPGSMREASAADRDLLVGWMHAFAVEALNDPDPDRDHVTRMVEHRLSSEVDGLALWEADGKPLSFSGFGGRTPKGIRIGPVYTPPELRGRGYASALVAQLSQQLLDQGRRFCFLYTDLANPVANRIYERLGYVKVCESAEIEFVATQRDRK